MAKYHPLLKCTVERIEYDFEERVGWLFMVDGNCCDMGGCIKFFTSIDPYVKFIATYAGAVKDTAYERDIKSGEWKAGIVDT